MSIEKISAVWPEWTVAEQLGEGTYGKVFKATREEHGVLSSAAIKVVSIPQSDAELSSMRAEGLDESGTRSYFAGIVSDFVNEIKAMESLKGTTNIVSIEDYKVVEKTDSIGWDIFIRMELLTPLNDYIADKKLSEAEVIKLGCDICQALELCAQRHIIHRDIKPENIFVSPFGDFKIGDFGVARELEKTGGSLSKKGTPNYMAPEIELSKGYDATVDIYSLGLVLYKLLNNNRLPFLDPYTQLLAYQDRRTAIGRRLSGEALPPPVEASPELAQIILTACAFDPAMRFQTPTAFKNALGSPIGVASRPAPSPVPVSSLDETVSVRRAPQADNLAQAGIPVASFGKEKKKSNAKVFAIAMVVLLSIGGSVAGYHFLSPGGLQGIVSNVTGGNTVANVIAALEAGEYAEALALVEELDGHSDTIQSNLQSSLRDRLRTLEVDFLSDEMEYAVVMMELNTIERMNISGLSSSITGTRDTVNRLNASRTAFNTAESLYERGNYAAAITQYIQVVQDDPNYMMATEGLIRAADAHRTATLAHAGNYSGGGDYVRAIRVLSDALLVLENDSALTQQLNIYRASHEAANRQAILDTAHEYAANSHWVRAIVTLNDGLRDLPGDTLMTERLRSYEALYIDEAIGDANAFVANGRFNDAVDVLNSVLQTLPNNTQLMEEVDRVEALRPVSLAAVAIVEAREYFHNTELFADSFGNEHRESHRFNPQITSGAHRSYSAPEDSAYVVYNLNGNFKTFSADIVAPARLNHWVEFLITITLDNQDEPILVVERFNSRTIARTLELDVSGVTTMTITVRVRVADMLQSGNHSIHLVNTVLFPADS